MSKFFLCLAYLCVKRELSKSLWLVLALIIFSRPEGFLFAFLFALADTRERRKSLLMSVILILVVLLLRLIYFQDILPNTIWAKWGLVHSSDPLLNFNLGLRYYWSWLGHGKCYRAKICGIRLQSSNVGSPRRSTCKTRE